MDGVVTPPPLPTNPAQNLLIPVAGVLIILIFFFLLGVIALICIRKILLNRGVDMERWQFPCKCVGGDSFSSPCCVDLAERLDCDTPNTGAWLDGVCPSRQQCSTFWSRVFSGYCCHTVSDNFKTIKLCPDCICPSCTCPCQCECECTPPQCHEINCICCKINL